MAILKIKLIDASGAALVNQTVKVSDAGVLQTNADGVTQFLLGDGGVIEIEIAGLSCWTGDSSKLSKEEVFQQSSSGFVRVAGH
jgi:hypothetical protein